VITATAGTASLRRPRRKPRTSVAAGYVETTTSGARPPIMRARRGPEYRLSAACPATRSGERENNRYCASKSQFIRPAPNVRRMSSSATRWTSGPITSSTSTISIVEAGRRSAIPAAIARAGAS